MKTRTIAFPYSRIIPHLPSRTRRFSESSWARRSFASFLAAAANKDHARNTSRRSQSSFVSRGRNISRNSAGKRKLSDSRESGTVKRVSRSDSYAESANGIGGLQAWESYSVRTNQQFDTQGLVHTCNITAYRNTVSWQCGRDSWPRNVSKVG